MPCAAIPVHAEAAPEAKAPRRLAAQIAGLDAAVIGALGGASLDVLAAPARAVLLRR